MSNPLLPKNPYQAPLHPINSTKKIYTKGWILFGTYLGGPLAGGYYVSKNFETFGQQNYADKALKIGIVATIAFFGLFAFIPPSITSKVPNFIIPICYLAILSNYLGKYQDKMLETHLKNGGEKYSGWKVFCIAVACLVISLAFFFTLLLALPMSIL